MTVTNPSPAEIAPVFALQQANQWNVKATSADVRKAKLTEARRLAKQSVEVASEALVS